MAESYPEVKNHSVGIHVSISKKLDLAVDRAIEAGCVGTFQIFTCSPRQWNASNLKQEEVVSFKRKMHEFNFQTFAHMPYLPNLSSPDSKFFAKSVKVLKREMARCDQLGVKNLVLHFGSHMGTSIEQGHRRIIDACNEALSQGGEVRLLLENSAGVKNSVGSEFPHIRRVIDRLSVANRVGVCLDTCHAFAAGYDLSSEESVHAITKKFDVEIGLEKLFLIHLNDSKGKLGDGLDRHEHIGKGCIGPKGMSAILHERDLSHIPVVLETPMEKEGDDKQDIETVKKLILN